MTVIGIYFIKRKSYMVKISPLGNHSDRSGNIIVSPEKKYDWSLGTLRHFIEHLKDVEYIKDVDCRVSLILRAFKKM